MVVAAGAANGQAEENRAHRAGDLGELILPLHLRNDVSAHDLARPAPSEAGGDQGRVVTRLELVAGKLQGDEPVIRHVGIERAHHPVAIAPGVRALGVELETVRVGIMSEVEPVLGPTLAMVGAFEKPINQPLIGVAPAVSQEGGDLLRELGAGRSGRSSGDGSGQSGRPRAHGEARWPRARPG